MNNSKVSGSEGPTPSPSPPPPPPSCCFFFTESSPGSNYRARRPQRGQKWSVLSRPQLSLRVFNQCPPDDSRTRPRSTRRPPPAEFSCHQMWSQTWDWLRCLISCCVMFLHTHLISLYCHSYSSPDSSSAENSPQLHNYIILHYTGNQFQHFLFDSLCVSKRLSSGFSKLFSWSFLYIDYFCFYFIPIYHIYLYTTYIVVSNWTLCVSECYLYNRVNNNWWNLLTSAASCEINLIRS